MTRFVLICPEPIRTLQQGIGIRFLEMAAELSRIGRVSLWVPNADHPPVEGFEIRPLPGDDFPDAIGGVAAVVIHGHLSEWYFSALARFGLGEGPPLVVDLYDPFLIENLHYTEELGDEVYRRDRRLLIEQLARGDFFITSSQAQRVFYLGLMIGIDRFSPADYRDDRTLNHLLDVAPYGVRPVSAEERERAVGRIKGEVPGIEPGDVVLFFGGVYDWYDPELLLDVLDDLVRVEPRLRVLFSANPNPETTPQGVYRRVRERAEAQGWIGRHVFFLPWFPFAERVAFFKDVDLAVSLHHPSIEIEVSLRTRVLEYMNLALPVVATEGGESSAIVQRSGTGTLVPAGDAQRLRETLTGLLRDPRRRAEMGARGPRWVAENMVWERTLAPLVAFCRAPRRGRTVMPLEAPAAARVGVGDALAYLRRHGPLRFARAVARRLVRGVSS